MAAQQSFHDRLWASIQPLWPGIVGHPFLVELAQGTLSSARFAYFLEQDALYLEDFARLLASAAAKAPDRDQIKLFLSHAQGVFAVESSLHETLATALGRDPSGLTMAQRGRTTQEYLDFLFGHANGGDYADLVMALLPCFWVYRQVGLALAQGPICPNPLYRRWIDTYAAEGFGESVASQIALADELATANPHRQASFAEIFTQGVRHERAFWDQAYSEGALMDD